MSAGTYILFLKKCNDLGGGVWEQVWRVSLHKKPLVCPDLRAMKSHFSGVLQSKCQFCCANCNINKKTYPQILAALQKVLTLFHVIKFAFSKTEKKTFKKGWSFQSWDEENNLSAGVKIILAGNGKWSSIVSF